MVREGIGLGILFGLYGLSLTIFVDLRGSRSYYYFFFFFSSRRRHTRFLNVTWSSDVCSSDLSERNMNFQLAYRRDALPEVKFFETLRDAELYAASIVEDYGATIIAITDLRALRFYY